MTNNGKSGGGGVYLDNSSRGVFQSVTFDRNSGTTGSGVYAPSGTSAVFTQCVFNGNINGAGLYYDSAIPMVISGTQFITHTSSGLVIASNAANAVTLINTDFHGNSTAGNGAGVNYVPASGMLTITNGGFYTNTAATNGGGLYAYRVNISGTTFYSNTANGGYGGGGVVGAGSVLTNPYFALNYASTNGGGLYSLNSAAESIFVLQGLFYTNTAGGSGSGGALYVGDSAVLSGTQFISNTASANGGAVYLGAGNGGASELTHTLFISNVLLSSTGYGGALSSQGSVTVTGGGFYSNTTPAGGGGGGALAVRTPAKVATINGVVFAGNISHNGGAIFADSTQVQLRVVNTLLARNRARIYYGAAVFVAPSNLGTARAEIVHSTIVSPSVPAGTQYAIYSSNITLAVTNTIVATYSQGLYSGDGRLSLDFNLFQNVTTPFNTGIDGGHNLLNADAGFVNPALDDYQLSSNTSQAINAAWDLGLAADISGAARPQNGAPDIGAYEASVTGPFALVAGPYAVVTPGSAASLLSSANYDAIFSGVPLTRTFVISNTGAAALTLAGSLTGPAAADFTLTQPVSTTLEPGEGTTFQLGVNTSVLGMRAVTVSLTTNDAARSPYTFGVRGTSYTGTITVTTVLSTGAGSLRDALTNIGPGGRILFDPALSGQVISVGVPLTTVRNVIVDGVGLANPIRLSAG